MHDQTVFVISLLCVKRRSNKYQYNSLYSLGFEPMRHSRHANYYIRDEYPELNYMQNSKCSKSWYSIVTLVWSYYDDMPTISSGKTNKSKAKIKQKEITDLIFIICQKIIHFYISYDKLASFWSLNIYILFFMYNYHHSSCVNMRC